MEEWKEYKLGEIAQIQTGPFGSQLHKSDYVDDGVPCIMPTNIGKNLDVISDGIVHISENDAQRLSRHLVTAGDIIYARRGDIEKCAYIQEQQNGWFCGTGCLRIRINKDADSHFIAYQLSTSEAKSWIVGNAVGTTMLNLNSSILSDLPVLLPSLFTQRHITAILKSLDDKIEVNRQINDNLEQQAQALFRSWFVDFEPFKDGEFVESELGLIPKMWRVGHLDEILTIRKESYRKGDDINLPYLPIDIIPMHSLGIIEFKDNNEAQSSLQTFEKNDIIIGAMRVYFHRVVIAPCKGITRNTCFVLYPNSEDYWAYSVLQCNQKDTIDFANRTSKGSTMPYAVWNNGLGNCNIIIPNSETMRQFNIIAKHLLIKIRDSYKESRRLAELRDTLLPRLMSGEIDINKVCI